MPHRTSEELSGRVETPHLEQEPLYYTGDAGRAGQTEADPHDVIHRGDGVDGKTAVDLSQRFCGTLSHGRRGYQRF